MAASTVNISFQENLLGQIGRIAQNEDVTQSELIREAARIYVERKKKCERLSSKCKFTEDEVNNEIKKCRER
jgi:metal-responsive CopG/Arc/MetJ family transcriptional regulator